MTNKSWILIITKEFTLRMIMRSISVLKLEHTSDLMIFVVVWRKLGSKEETLMSNSIRGAIRSTQIKLTLPRNLEIFLTKSESSAKN